MDDLSGKINELLSNPAALAQIQSLAASLGLGGSGESGGNGGGGGSFQGSTPGGGCIGRARHGPGSADVPG